MKKLEKAGRSESCRILAWVLVLFLLIGYFAFPDLSASPSSLILQPQGPGGNRAGKAEVLTAKVVNVIDGDTMTVRIGKNKEKIRLLLVDTPETVDPRRPVEPFGPEAASFAKAALDGRTVTLEVGPTRYDKYGRLLCYLWVGDRLFNELLLEKGLARAAYAEQADSKYGDAFRTVERQARHAKIGIWSIDHYVHADGFYITAN